MKKQRSKILAPVISEIDKEVVAKKIAGDIVVSPEPGKTIQKWRNVFKVTQKDLARAIGVTPSVISDYENSRRRNPGIFIINKIAGALINLDEQKGGYIIHEFVSTPDKTTKISSLLGFAEFHKGVSVKEFCKIIDATLVTNLDLVNNKIYGYSIIDAVKAILEFPSAQLLQMYTLTNNKAVIFLGTHRGRSSMIALKASNLKPSLVVFQTPQPLDDLARRISELEGIPVATTKQSTECILERLKKRFKE